MIVFADTDTAEGLGRAVNAPTTAKEFRDAGDEALIVFDGAGTKWAAELSDPEHEYHQLLEDAKNWWRAPAPTARVPSVSVSRSSRVPFLCSTSTTATRACGG
jgi:hypothetical protein